MTPPAIPIAIDPARPLPEGAASVGAIPRLPLWDALRSQYQAVRPVSLAPDGEPYPETTAGDVRLASIHLSRALCHARFDHAQLADARAAWRDALGRAAAFLAAVGWDGAYPENRRFWLGDALALAQRLGTIDARRNGITPGDDGPRVVGEYRDLSVLWNDLRHWYLERRIVRRSRGVKYPETTVGDVRAVARLLSEHSGLHPTSPVDVSLTRIGVRLATDVSQQARVQALLARWRDAVARWRTVLVGVERLAAGLGPDDTYPDNPRFWLGHARAFADEAGAVHRILEGGR